MHTKMLWKYSFSFPKMQNSSKKKLAQELWWENMKEIIIFGFL